jgi:hypothetical protein
VLVQFQPAAPFDSQFACEFLAHGKPLRTMLL